MGEERTRRSCAREEAMGVVRGAIWNRHNLQLDQEIEPRPADAKVRREPTAIIDSYLFFRHRIISASIDEFPPRWNHQETIRPRRIFSDPSFVCESLRIFSSRSFFISRLGEF